MASIELSACRAGAILAKKPPPPQWVLNRFLARGHLGLVVGPAGTGKSQFLLQLAGAVATGCPALAGCVFEVGEPGAVLGIFGEEDDVFLHRRLEALHARAEFLDVGEALKNNLVAVPGVGLDLSLAGSDKNRVQPTKNFKALLQLAEGVDNLKLVILDPLSRFHALAEENANSTMHRFAGFLEHVGQKTGAAVVIAHHVHKGAGFVGGQFDLGAAMCMDVARGASSLVGAVRAVANVFPMPGRAAKKLVDETGVRDGSHVVVGTSKVSHGPLLKPAFLSRDGVGFLHKAKPRPEVDDEARLAALVDAVVERVAGLASKTTARNFARLHKEAVGGTEREVLTSIAQALAAGRLVAVEVHGRAYKYLEAVTAAENGAES